MIELLNIDCMEYMKSVPDKYFELAIVDPPYGIGFDRENTTMSAGARKDGTKRNMSSWSNPREKGYKTKNWDIKPSIEYFTELMRVSKNQIIWGGNYFTDYLYPTGGWIVWEKGVPDGMSLSQAKLAWNSLMNSVQLTKVLWAGYKKEEKEERVHPTQKPIKLYKWVLNKYAKPGDKILDTHLGSGSIAIACHDMNFDLVGCELDKDYYEAALKRFNNHKLQQTLF